MSTSIEHLYLPVGPQRYNSWTGMNAKRYFMSLKLTQAVASPRANDEDYSDGGSYVRFGRIPAGLSSKQKDQLVRAVSDTLSQHGCEHEYDCCGCPSYSTSASLKRRQIRIETHVGYNY